MLSKVLIFLISRLEYNIRLIWSSRFLKKTRSGEGPEACEIQQQQHQQQQQTADLQTHMDRTDRMVANVVAMVDSCTNTPKSTAVVAAAAPETEAAAAAAAGTSGSDTDEDGVSVAPQAAAVTTAAAGWTWDRSWALRCLCCSRSNRSVLR